MIRFQSKVTADLVMFNEHGSVLLEIWGKKPGAKGILLAAEMAEADAASGGSAGGGAGDPGRSEHGRSQSVSGFV